MAYNVDHFEISNNLSCRFLVQKHTKLPSAWWSLHESCKGGGGGLDVLCVCGGDWASEKLSGGKSSSKVTRLDGECSKILVSNPG